MNTKQCDIINKQTEGASTTIGLLGVGLLLLLYNNTESNYPGSGLQSLIYGGAIIGGAYMVSSTALNIYKGTQC